MFCGRLTAPLLFPPHEVREFVRQLDELGSKSLPLAALAGAATGVVLPLSTRDGLMRLGAKSLLPAVIVLSIIKESGPIITALVVSGRAAAGIGAELGAMKVTEQIDAIEISAVKPKLPRAEKTEPLWGRSGFAKEWPELRRFAKALSRMDDCQRRLLLGTAQRMASRNRS